MLSVVYHRVQNQVTEVIDVMKDNIGKVLDRGEKLSELESKSGKLIIGDNNTARNRVVL